MVATPTPTAKLTGSAPVILVKNVIASANYYRDSVGFSYDRFWGDPPGFCILTRDAMHIMMDQVEDATLVAPNSNAYDGAWDIYFWVDNVDALHQELQQREAIMHTGLCNQSYGCRECSIHDLDGYVICFGQVLED